MMNGPTKQYLVAVGLDGSKSSWNAFNEALELCKSKQAMLHVISIQESVEASYSASEVLASEQTAHQKLEQIQIKARLQAETAKVSMVAAIVGGRPEAALVDYVKAHSINLLIIGDTGHSSIWGALLGTTAEKIVRSAPCSILIVR